MFLFIKSLFLFIPLKTKKKCKEKSMIWPSSFRSKRQPDPRSLFSAVYGNYKWVIIFLFFHPFMKKIEAWIGSHEVVYYCQVLNQQLWYCYPHNLKITWGVYNLSTNFRTVKCMVISSFITTTYLPILIIFGETMLGNFAHKFNLSATVFMFSQ